MTGAEVRTKMHEGGKYCCGACRTCPTCKAKPLHECVTRDGFKARGMHKARVALTTDPKIRALQKGDVVDKEMEGGDGGQ